MRFKKGDVVRLNTGGPVLTVREVSIYGIECTWVDRERKERQSLFHPMELRALGESGTGAAPETAESTHASR